MAIKLKTMNQRKKVDTINFKSGEHILSDRNLERKISKKLNVVNSKHKIEKINVSNVAMLIPLT